jgi:hypothetical protein
MAEPTHLAGQNTTLDINQSQRVIDMEDKIFLLEPRKSPFVTFLTTVGKAAPDGSNYKGVGLLKKEAISPKFEWLEDAYGGQWTQIDHSGGYAAGDTTLHVDNADLFIAGDELKVPRTGETMWVSSVDWTAETITVVRSLGGTAAASLNDNDYIFLIGNVNEEGATARTANTTKTTSAYNYTQIFRDSIDSTGTLEASELYGTGKGELPYLRGKYGHTHCVHIEKAFWFGERAETTGATTKAMRATGGVLEYITTNVTNQSSTTLTETEFITFLSTGFAKGSSEKILFADSRILQTISGYALGQQRIQPNENKYGVAIAKYFSPFGTVNIVMHPEFKNSYAGYAFLLDLDCFKYRYLRGRDTKLKLNIQANDVDGEKDEFMTECGLERINEERNAYLYGVTL